MGCALAATGQTAGGRKDLPTKPEVGAVKAPRMQATFWFWALLQPRGGEMACDCRGLPVQVGVV
jgi:hypothetical protein